MLLRAATWQFKFVLGTFPTTTASYGQLSDLFWEAVSSLEMECKLKVNHIIYKFMQLQMASIIQKIISENVMTIDFKFESLFSKFIWGSFKRNQKKSDKYIRKYFEKVKLFF